MLEAIPRVQYDGSSFIPPCLLLMHEPVSSHSTAPHLRLYRFTSFIVSSPLLLCHSYGTPTFSPFLSSLFFTLSSSFTFHSTFHIQDFIFLSLTVLSFIPKSSYTSTEKCVRADTDWSTCICEIFTFSGLELGIVSRQVYACVCTVMHNNVRKF